MATLLLIRHGQSQWNLENRFTGWTDVPLTERGEADTRTTAKFIKSKGYRFDVAFTSRLQRAKRTLEIILEVLGLQDIPMEMDSALNERHYGDLQGLNKAETAAKYGQEKVLRWRRSYSESPPGGESIENCVKRTTPFFTHYILPHVHRGKNVLVAASGNSMRPMVKYLENLEPEETAEMEIGLCTPYVYFFKGKEMVKKEILEVPGVVTLGASQTQMKVKEGRV
jgi:2,3-bisphosphoglycerate-dependent phosphoglycerate mutase